MIDRYHLRYFLAVIDQGNFSRAAAACNVSQPTLSVGIARMEAMLGKPLFVRSNRRVELTAAGAELAVHARRIEAGFAQAEGAIAGTDAARRTRIGVLASLPGEWIEAFLHDHRASASAERIEIVEGRERELNDRLARGRIDVALTILRDPGVRDTGPRGPVRPGAEGLGDRRLLFSEGYSLAAAAGHPAARRPAIAAEELVNEPMIVRRHCELLAETSRHFTARGVRPFFPARTTSDARALGYVRAGLGVTVMPDCFAAPGVARVPLADFPFTRDIGLLFPPRATVPEDAREETIAQLVATVGRVREPGFTG